jgi:hypothetical protein
LTGAVPAGEGPRAAAIVVRLAALVACAGAAVPFAPIVPAGSVARAAVRAAEPCPGNLLVNPGFEQGFSIRQRMTEMLAVGWSSWFETGAGAGAGYEPPTYAPRFRWRDSADTVIEGLWSQEMATRAALHTGGLYQRVGVTAGSMVEASAWARAWASNGDDPARSEPPNTYALLIGIDPLGGADASSRYIEWSTPITLTDQWLQLTVQAPVEGTVATLFLRGQSLLPLKHNVSRWDGTCLRIMGPIGAPTLTATEEPWPTDTPGPEEATAQAALMPALAMATRESLAESLEATVAARALEPGAGLPSAPIGPDMLATAAASGDIAPEWSSADDTRVGPAAAPPWRRALDSAGLAVLTVAGLVAGLALALNMRAPAGGDDAPGHDTQGGT